MPNPQPLKNIGQFHTQDHLTDGPAIRNARELLQETMRSLKGERKPHLNR